MLHRTRHFHAGVELFPIALEVSAVRDYVGVAFVHYPVAALNERTDLMYEVSSKLKTTGAMHVSLSAGSLISGTGPGMVVVQQLFIQ